MPILNRDLIVAIREAEGLSQLDLAALAKMRRRVIQKAESQKSENVELDTFAKIAGALRIRPPALLLQENHVEFTHLRRLRSGGYVAIDANDSPDGNSIPPVPPIDQASYLKLLAEDEALGRDYATFTTTTRKHYREIMTKNRRFDLSLEELIHGAGTPPHVANGDTELVDWPKIMVPELDKIQQLMWEFATQVYPSRRLVTDGNVWEYSSIRPVATAEAFHWSRRALAKHWDKWFPLVGWTMLGERFLTRRDEVLLIAWLELALIQWTRCAGMHKQGLFTLAEAYANTLPQLEERRKTHSRRRDA